MLGVVKYTTEGEPLCHEWSKGDPRYTQEETQKKIDLWTKGQRFAPRFAAESMTQNVKAARRGAVADPAWPPG